MAEGKATIEVHLKPNAGCDEIVWLGDGVLRARVAAPPVGGKANGALLGLLAGVLGVPKGNLSLIRGHASRHKVVAVDGLSAGELRERLARALPGKGSSPR